MMLRRRARVHAMPEAGHHAALERGDFLIAGRAVSAGILDDEPALALARQHVGGILAESIHPAFRESLLHAGIPILTQRGLGQHIRPGHDLIVDFAAGTIENVTTHRVQVAEPLSFEEIDVVRQAPALVLCGGVGRYTPQEHAPSSGDGDYELLGEP